MLNSWSEVHIYIYMYKQERIYMYIYIYIYACVCLCVCVCVCEWVQLYIYIYIYIHGAFNKFSDFFLYSHLRFLLLYILWDHWPILMISASNEQLQQELEYTLLKPNCHSWWISKNAIWQFRRTISNKILF